LGEKASRKILSNVAGVLGSPKNKKKSSVHISKDYERRKRLVGKNMEKNFEPKRRKLRFPTTNLRKKERAEDIPCKRKKFI